MKFTSSYYAITLSPSKIYSLIKQCGGEVVFSDAYGNVCCNVTANDFWAKRSLVYCVKIGNKLFFKL